MVTLLRFGITLWLSLLISSCASDPSPSGPPAARVDNAVDVHWGTEVPDPYRYMENLEDPYVREWFEGQARFAAHTLENLPSRDALYARLKELDAGKPFHSFWVRRLADGSRYYLRRHADENLGKLYVEPAGAAEPRLLVDPESWQGDGEQHYSIETYMPSWDGRYLAYGLAQGGSEETTYYVMDVASGENLGERIDSIETAYNRPQWSLDARGFFYSHRRDLSADAPATEIYKQTRVRYHALGTDPAEDPVIAAYGISDRLPISEVDFPSIVITPGSSHAVLKIKHGDSNEISLYAAPRDTLLEDDIPWRALCDADDQVVDFAVAGDTLYLLTAQGAPRYKLVALDLRSEDFRAARDVIPASELVLDGIYAAADALYMDARRDGVNVILRLGWTDKIHTVLATPGGRGAAYVSSVSPNVAGIYAYVSGWTRGALTYSYDPASKQFSDTELIPVGKFDALPGFTSTEVLVPSHDGTPVPLSIIHRSDIPLNGKNPTIVYGYGSYGISMDVYFSATRLAWLERGGVFAVAHVRGGGEYGQAWHYDGRMENKPNTWKDLIACAEYLVAKGYTSPAHMAPMGGSAGGILVGRAITERPDLFGAAVIEVGMADTIRAETTTNGVPNIKEFGTVTERSGFEGLLAMSPYHNVEDGVAYPAVLLTHGYNDRRVEPWMSGKMAARLQAATASGKPVLLRVTFDAGHGIGSTQDQYLQETADIYSFLLATLR